MRSQSTSRMERFNFLSMGPLITIRVMVIIERFTTLFLLAIKKMIGIHHLMDLT